MRPDNLTQLNLNKFGMVSVDTALEAFIWTWKALLLMFKVKTEEHLYTAFNALLCTVRGPRPTFPTLTDWSLVMERKVTTSCFRPRSPLCSSRTKRAGERAAWHAVGSRKGRSRRQKKLVESKTPTYHGRVVSGHTAG